MTAEEVADRATRAFAAAFDGGRPDGVDVSDVAAALGGGGHPAAAGCTQVGDAPSVIGRIRGLLG